MKSICIKVDGREAQQPVIYSLATHAGKMENFLTGPVGFGIFTIGTVEVG